jgi:predicted HD phosphohydrolase
VAALVEGHVLAKRYLTGTDPQYHDLLDSSSKVRHAAPPPPLARA